MRRLLPLLLTSALVVGAVAALPAGASAAKRTCDERPGRTLAHDGLRRVFVTQKGSGAVTYRFFVCKAKSKAAPKLLERLPVGKGTDVSFRALFAGTGGVWLVQRFLGGSSDFASIKLFSATSGAEQASYEGGEETQVDEVGVTDDGALAFTYSSNVYTFDASGAKKQASGASDLAVGRTRAYWRVGGTVQSVELAGTPTGTLTLP